MDTVALAKLTAIGRSLKVKPGELTLEEIQAEHAAEEKRVLALRQRIVFAHALIATAQDNEYDFATGEKWRNNSRAQIHRADEIAEERRALLQAFAEQGHSEAFVVQLEEEAKTATEAMRELIRASRQS